VKIVSVLTSRAPGGAEFAAVTMLDALAARGHEAVLLTDQPDPSADVTGVAIRRLQIGPKLSQKDAWRVVLWPLYLARLRQQLSRESPYDVLLLHFKKEQLVARYLPRRLRRTVVWAEWGPLPRQLRSGFGRKAYLRAARDVRLVMAISEGTRRTLCEVGLPDEKIAVVPNVMRPEDAAFTTAGRERVRRQASIPEDAFVVGCISRFHPLKRNDVVIRAVQELPTHVHLVLAGDGEDERELRTLAAPLGERVHFLPTPREDVADVLSAFDVSVFCPSPTEGAPRAVLLAMLNGRPCVATGPEGVVDIIAPDSGAIVNPEHDPEALAHTLRTYVENSEQLQMHGRRALEVVRERHDPAIVAARIESLLRGAIAKNSGARARPHVE
jgi:glycosyltransferase involved in cell wall biosynthesis